MPNLRLWHPHERSLGSVSCRKSEVPERVESKYNSPFCTISKDIEEYKRMVQVRQVEWINEKEALSDRSELSQDKWNSPFCRISETCCQENQVFCPKNGLESIWSSIDEKESVILTPLHSARNFPVPKKKEARKNHQICWMENVHGVKTLVISSLLSTDCAPKPSYLKSCSRIILSIRFMHNIKQSLSLVS